MKFLVFLSIPLLFFSCIGDDIILDETPEVLRITNRIDSLELGTTYQLETQYLNNVGQEETPEITWRSSDEQIISIDAKGTVQGLAEGRVLITAEVELADEIVSDTLSIQVADRTTVAAVTSRKGSIRTTSSYLLGGDFEVRQEGAKLLIEVAENYEASTSLPGLYLYLTNNPNTINDALEIGKVEVFKGAHTYELDGVNISAYNYLLYYCKPFRVKVGDGEIE